MCRSRTAAAGSTLRALPFGFRALGAWGRLAKVWLLPPLELRGITWGGGHDHSASLMEYARGAVHVRAPRLRIPRNVLKQRAPATREGACDVPRVS